MRANPNPLSRQKHRIALLNPTRFQDYSPVTIYQGRLSIP